MKLKILTVDGSQTIRLIVAQAFKSFDCDFLEGANWVEGLAVANREKPDLIILDRTMPIRDGPEILSQLKGTDFNLVSLGLSTFQLYGELSIKHRIIGSDLVQQECKLYEDTKDGRFVGSMGAAKAAFAVDVA